MDAKPKKTLEVYISEFLEEKCEAASQLFKTYLDSIEGNTKVTYLSEWWVFFKDFYDLYCFSEKKTQETEHLPPPIKVPSSESMKQLDHFLEKFFVDKDLNDVASFYTERTSENIGLGLLDTHKDKDYGFLSKWWCFVWDLSKLPTDKWLLASSQVSKDGGVGAKLNGLNEFTKVGLQEWEEDDRKKKKRSGQNLTRKGKEVKLMSPPPLSASAESTAPAFLSIQDSPFSSNFTESSFPSSEAFRIESVSDTDSRGLPHQVESRPPPPTHPDLIFPALDAAIVDAPPVAVSNQDSDSFPTILSYPSILLPTITPPERPHQVLPDIPAFDAPNVTVPNQEPVFLSPPQSAGSATGRQVLPAITIVDTDDTPGVAALNVAPPVVALQAVAPPDVDPPVVDLPAFAPPDVAAPAVVAPPAVAPPGEEDEVQSRYIG